MLSLVETIAKALVSNPDEVVVREISNKGDSMVIELKVCEKDMGKVIGKQGRIAKALRTVVKAAATKQNIKVTVEIVS
ncbi:MAG: KH domain-containing protein [Firmicutes bacterium]|nr:KH domain-containing protein [Bacillota bacterium]